MMKGWVNIALILIFPLLQVLNTSVPFFLSHAIDNLNSTGVLDLDPATSQAAVTTAVTAALVSSELVPASRRKEIGFS